MPGASFPEHLVGQHVAHCPSEAVGEGYQESSQL